MRPWLKTVGSGFAAYAVAISLAFAWRDHARSVVARFQDSGDSIPTLDRLAVALAEGHWHALVGACVVLCLGLAALVGVARGPAATRARGLWRLALGTGGFLVGLALTVAALSRGSEAAELGTAFRSLARGPAQEFHLSTAVLRLSWLWAPLLFAALLGADRETWRAVSGEPRAPKK